QRQREPVRHPEPAHAEVRERRRDDRDDERQKDDAEEIAQQPQERKQNDPDDHSAVSLVELLQAEGARGARSLHVRADRSGTKYVSVPLASSRVIRYLARSRSCLLSANSLHSQALTCR